MLFSDISATRSWNNVTVYVTVSYAINVIFTDSQSGDLVTYFCNLTCVVPFAPGRKAGKVTLTTLAGTPTNSVNYPKR